MNLFIHNTHLLLLLFRNVCGMRNWIVCVLVYAESGNAHFWQYISIAMVLTKLKKQPEVLWYDRYSE